MNYRVSLCGALFFLSHMAWGAEPSTTPSSLLEEVVVTASRIERPDYSYSNPVLSVTGEDIRQSGVRDMSRFLKQIPALIGSLDDSDTAGGSFIGTNGLTGLNLRNLGFERTLVLVNGRRYVGSPFPGGAVVDVDTLPANLIERVEVMTGGASALYGADAVSGVVNFVLKDHYEGFDLNVESGASSKHDAQSQSVAFSFGTPVANDRGHFSVALNYKTDQHLNYKRRDFTSDGFYHFVQNPDNPNDDPNLPDQVPVTDLRFADSSRAGAVDINLDAIPEFDGDGSLFDPGQFIEPYYQIGGSGQPVGEFLSDMLPDKERYALNTLFDFEITDKLKFFSELAYTNTDSRAKFEPIFDYILAIFPDSPYIPDNIATAAAGNPLLVSKDNWDMGIRIDETERETYRGVLGLEGALSESLDFEISYTYGETDVEQTTLNNRYNDRMAAAVDAVLDPVTGNVVCRSELDPTAEPFNLAFQEWNDYTPQPGTWAGSFTPGTGACVPLNTFGDGAPSQAAIDWIMLDTLSTANLKQHLAQAYVRGNTANWFELPAGAVGFVFGTEYRKEKVSNKTAEEDRLGYTYGNKFEGDQGQQEVFEVFAEFDIPLIADAKFAKHLAVDAAIRYSDYTSIGTTTTWKGGLIWQPFDSLTFRGTIAEAIRAPSIQELYSPAGDTFEFFNDPCDINNLDNGTEFRVDNCASLLTPLGIDPSTYTDPNSGVPLKGLGGGNPNLDKESADTATWGLIYSPAYLEGLTISLDWYDIELEDAITFVLPQSSADLCVDLPSVGNEYCDLITRGANGGIVDFQVLPINVAAFTTRGVDFSASYFIEPSHWGASDAWGTFIVQLTGNKLKELKRVYLPGATPVSDLGQRYAPEWQANLELEWNRANTTLRWELHYFDETNRFDDVTVDNNPNIAARKYLKFDRKLTQDVYGSYEINEQFRFYLGINNLTDEKPEIGEEFYPVSAVGRYIFAGLNFSL